jgi:hypothetical protein
MAAQDEAEREAAGALVATRVARSTAGRWVRPDASLVAQLLAARLDLPESRRHRRAAPEDAADAYEQAGARLGALPPRGRLSRSA